MLRLASLTLVTMWAMTAPALAHTGIGDTHGVVHGFAHPVSGIDHVLAMLAVGLFAAQLGGRALWLVPLAFVSMMAVGGTIGVVGFGLPFVEIGIGLSVVALGIALAARWHLPTVAAMALVGFFAIFHGHAHGTEMPDSVSGLTYGLGFIIATAMLHAVGIGLGGGIGKMTEGRSYRPLQTMGGAMALAGVAILAGYL